MAFAGNCGRNDGFNVALLSAKVVRGRWFMMYAGLLIMSAAGGSYIFGIYSKDLKSSLGYNQQTLNTMSFFKDLGNNVGLLSGFINEVSPPWAILLIGAAMNLSGYLMIYLAVTARIARPPVWLMCLYICVGANSQTFANTGVLITCVKSFPESRGIVLGLLKCFVGLSGAIFTQFYLALYGGQDSKSLVLLMAWLPAVISVLFAYTIRLMEPPRGSPAAITKPFYSFLYLTTALAAYLFVSILVEKLANFSRAEYIANSAVVLFLLFLPVSVAIKEEVHTIKKSKEDLKIDHQSLPPPISTSFSAVSATPDEDIEKKPKPAVLTAVADIFSPPALGEDFSILQALVSLDMLVLVVTTICGVGGTLTAVDNMGQIGESLGYTSKSINTFVSLISIWNATGRIAAGFLSEIFLDKYKLPRPLMLTLVQLLAAVGHLLIAFGVPSSLYAASVVIGFCLGAHWPLLFAIISEIFGLKRYSTLFNVGASASPIGSYLLNVLVAGRLYDRQAETQNLRVQPPALGNSGEDLTCIGVKCFQLSFLIITAATLFGAAVSLILVVRTKKFYEGDIYAKFREPAPPPPTMDESVIGVGAAAEVDGAEIISFADEHQDKEGDGKKRGDV